MKKTLCFILLAILVMTGCSKEEPQSTLVSGPGYEFPLPDGFEEMELEGYECYYSASDGSCVNLNIQPADEAFLQVTADRLRQVLAQALSQAYGEDVVITDDSFTVTPISGRASYQYAFSYELQGRAVRQLVVGVNADQCYTFTYTDMSGDWIEQFRESAKAIRLNEQGQEPAGSSQ